MTTYKKEFMNKNAVMLFYSFALLITLVALLFPLIAAADVTVIWLDTSGSMNKEGRFESAKEVLAKEIEEAKPGDVLYIGHFDSNEYLLGRLAVGETGSDREKEEIIKVVRSLSAKGIWTNLDEPLQASKAILLEERAFGSRRIVLLSDGLSDPSPDHKPIDLSTIAQIVPQELGWYVYLIGLSEEIEGLFQTKSGESQIAVLQYPHIKGIPLREFTPDKIEDALLVAKNDPAEVSSNENKKLEPKQSPVVWSLLLVAFALTAISVPLLLVYRKNKLRVNLILGIRVGDGEEKELSVYFEEGARKTVGPKGDIQVDSEDTELPHVVFTLSFQKGLLWLTPHDSISVNGKSVTKKIPVGVGDLVKVRNKILILIKEGGGENNDTE